MSEATGPVIFSADEIAESRRTAVGLITALAGRDPYAENAILADHAMTRRTHSLVRLLAVIAKQGIEIAAVINDEPMAAALGRIGKEVAQ